MIEHDVANVGNMHALAKRGGGKKQTDLAFLEGGLDGTACLPWKAAVVIADERAQCVRQDLAESLRKRKGLLTAVDVADGLLRMHEESVEIDELLFCVPCIDNM